jgi:NAD(P)-dependent dehydrogenase (short-subunit alcohol dehydrogenase family)
MSIPLHASSRLGQPGEPDDIAKVVLFYASEAVNYVTGTMLIVDGGYLLS